MNYQEAREILKAQLSGERNIHMFILEEAIEVILCDCEAMDYIYECIQKQNGCYEIENPLIKKCIESREYKPTLREYIKKNSNGAYHHFRFRLNTHVDVDVIGVEEFEEYYKSHFLDEYRVIEDKQSDNGGNCENYCGIHNLTIEPIILKKVDDPK